MITSERASLTRYSAAKTALLLDNTQLGKSQVHVTAASNIDQVATAAGSTTAAGAEDDDHIPQEDKPRSRIVAEYLAHGYVLSDNVVQRAIDLDSKHGFSSKFTAALQNFDSKYKATDKAKEMDNKYQVTNKAYSAWAGLNSYFEKALGTPTGQKVRDFYVQGDRQVRDVHSEARRLADLKAGKKEAHAVSGTDNTKCGCGGDRSVCGCADGHCNCANCPKSSHATTTAVPASALSGSGAAPHVPQPVTGTSKTVCSCGGKDGICGCAPGKCACASCGKSSAAAVSEVKEAAQASGQTLPRETFGTV